MGYGFGYPLFNYYNPLVYYIGAVLSFILGFVWSAKVLFLTALLLGPISMYFLGKELWGKIGGLVSAVMFMFAPYRALDAYIRGALSELFAISLIPLIFLFIIRLIKNGRPKNFLALTFALGAFLLTHNVSVVIWGPGIFLWSAFWLHTLGRKHLKLIIFSFCLALGLSSFFILPALFEKGLVSADSLISGDLNFNVHFAAVRQLFVERSWGYGASRQGPMDDLSLQIGWPHWWLAALGVLIILYAAFKRASFKGSLKLRAFLLPLLLVSLFFVSVFMTHNKSAFIWDRVGILSFLQFPWRFLAVAVFSASLLAGFVATAVGGKYRNLLTAMLILATVALNWSYFRPEKLYLDVNDDNKLAGASWEEQQKGAIFDYLPITAVDPKIPALRIPLADTRSAQIKYFKVTSNKWELDVEARQDSEIEIPVLNFPNWTAGYYKLGTNRYGRITVNVPKGEHKIVANFKNTPIRTFANILSLLSLIFLGTGIKYVKSRKIIG